MLPDDSDEAAEGAPEWMVTFADLMSLLLTFFILLLSFSTTEVMKFREAMGSIREALGLHSPDDPSKIPTGKTPLTDEIAEIGSPNLPLAKVEKQLQAVLETFGLQDQGETQRTPFGVILRLKGDLMFQSGKAELSPETFDLLEGLARYIGGIGGRIDVIGHTDNVPISTPVYPSNWELSAARAGQVVRFLVEHGVAPERLRAIGQADTVPIADNSTPEGRARNRRVEFLFVPVTPGRVPETTMEELAKRAAAPPEPSGQTSAGSAPSSKPPEGAGSRSK